MVELKDFYNDGFGWICRQCENELRPQAGSELETKHARFMTEGEAESKKPELSTRALARWADPAQRTLMCPACGVTELADIS